MAKGFTDKLREAIDGTSEIIEGSINDASQPGDGLPPDEFIDCVQDSGFDLGKAAGEAEFEARMSGTFTEPAPDLMQDYLDAANSCGGIAAPEAPDVNLPTFISPVLAAVEVAFTPTELNVGEEEALAAHQAPDAFAAAYDEGKQAGMSSAFDQRLEERFEPGWGQNDAPPTEPPPIDTPAAGLDYQSPASDAFGGPTPPDDIGPSAETGSFGTGGWGSGDCSAGGDYSGGGYSGGHSSGGDSSGGD